MKIELHAHSREISPCGHLSVDELTSRYRDAGYQVVVLTNHFNTDVANALAARGADDFPRVYFDCIDRAAEIGRTKGVLVLPGCELRLDRNANDYLVFGMTAEHCRQWRDICAMSAADFGAFARENGILFYQAHPFRNGMTVVNPANLFGIEVQNTHPRHDSRNEIAAAWAERFHLHKIAGSDCHQPGDEGTSAIVTEEDVTSVDDLLEVLRNDRFRMERYC